jgi:hypothetical protein
MTLDGYYTLGVKNTWEKPPSSDNIEMPWR